MMLINRTLIWFKNGDEKLLSLNDRFFGISTLLNRLLNKAYNGKKIKFINIYFNTNSTYNLYPVLPKNSGYSKKGYLSYYGVFNQEQFNEMTKIEQDNFVWNQACYQLIELAESINDDDLLMAVRGACREGLELNLNPDYKMIESNLQILDQEITASVWVNFKEDGMYSKLAIEKEGQLIFEKNIDETKNGVEFFLEIYKAIDCDKNNIIIKGVRDVGYLPLKIPIDEVFNNIS